MKSKLKKYIELYISFFRIGILTFGGGLAMMPMLQREVVHDRGWCTEEEILDMYAISQCTPGIIAVNTATYVGVKEVGVLGGIFATLGVISPSLLIICLVASVLKSYINLPVVQHALAGIRVVVCSLMLVTVCTMCKKGIVDKLCILVFVAAFLLAIATPIPTAGIIVLAGITGVIARKYKKAKGGDKA